MRNDVPNHETVLELLPIMRRRWRTVAAAVAVALALGAVAAAQLPRQYVATAVIVAGTGEGIGDAQYIPALNDAATSLATMVVDPIVLRRALRQQGIATVNSEALAEHVTTRVPARTPRIEVRVEDRDPRRAARLANAIAREFSELVEARVARGASLSASVWQPASPPRQPSSPRPSMIAGLSLLVGLGFGTLLALVRERRDPTWESEEQMELVLGLPVLAVIPELDHAATPARRVTR